MKKLFSLVGALLLVNLLLPVSAAQAQDPLARCLGIHCFQMPVHQPNAFVTTQFGFLQGVMTMSSKDVALADGTTFDFSMAGVREELDYFLAFGRTFGVYLKGGGFALTGLNSDSALLFGGQGSFNGELGVAMSVLRGSSTAITVRVGVTKGKTLAVQPYPLINQIMNGGSLDATLMFSSSNSTGVAPALVVAQSLGAALGLQASAWMDYGKEDGETVKKLNGAAALDLDFGAFSTIPLALSGEFLYSKTLGQDYNEKTFGGGAYYSGRPDLQLGLFVSSTIYPKNALFVNGIDNLYGQLMMRYFF